MRQHLSNLLKQCLNEPEREPDHGWLELLGYLVCLLLFVLLLGVMSL